METAERETQDALEAKKHQLDQKQAAADEAERKRAASAAARKDADAAKARAEAERASQAASASASVVQPSRSDFGTLLMYGLIFWALTKGRR